MQAVLRLGFFPAGMENFPASDDNQRKAIRRVIDRCDYYVVLVAGRYGSLGPDNLSYTEEEFDYAVSEGIPVLAFVHGDPDSIPVGKTDKNDEARKRLEAFREKVSTGRIRNEWLNPDDLAAKVTVALVTAVKTHPRPGWVRGTIPGGEGKQAPQASVTGPGRVAPSKSMLREYLQADAYQFEELLSDALRGASEVAGSIRAASQIPQDEYLALVKRCEEATADLVAIAAETAYFGKDHQHDVLLAAVEQLSAVNEPRGGFVYLNQLRAYPAVLTFYAAGVAAVAKGNYALLRKFQSLPLQDPGHGRVPALRILSPSYALEGPLQVRRPDGSTLKTPSADRILQALKSDLLRLPRMNQKRFEELFSRFEYLNAIAAVLTKGAYPHYGRFVWHGAYMLGRNSLAEAVDAELKEQGNQWPPFKAGLFGPNLDTLKEAKASIDKDAVQINLQHH